MHTKKCHLWAQAHSDTKCVDTWTSDFPASRTKQQATFVWYFCGSDKAETRLACHFSQKLSVAVLAVGSFSPHCSDSDSPLSKLCCRLGLQSSLLPTLRPSVCQNCACTDPFPYKLSLSHCLRLSLSLSAYNHLSVCQPPLLCSPCDPESGGLKHRVCMLLKKRINRHIYQASFCVLQRFQYLTRT